MKPEMKKLWIDALRSGKYGQAQGTLKNLAGDMCCLGVLVHECIINDMVPDGISVVEEEDRIIVGMRDSLDTSIHSLGWQSRAAPMFGLRCGEAAYLAGKNDGGAPFSEVADWIEQNL